MLLKALSQPSSSAAMSSTAARGTLLPETVLALADARTHRRWSHCAASTRFEPSSGRYNNQTRAFSATSNTTTSGNDGGGAARQAPIPLSRRPIEKTAAKDEDPNPLPPGAALKRAANALDILNTEPDLPPWHAASQERLFQKLSEYKNDLASAKKSIAVCLNEEGLRLTYFFFY
jgi:hypothetical protein